MDIFAKKCIKDHRNPLVKPHSIPVQKLFFAAKTEDEKKCIEEHQEHLKTVLEHQKIEKRSARAQAIWLSNSNLAQVTKIVKNLVKNFGFQNKDGIFIYPEEMLYLLESNKLEVNYNGRPLSIEKSYEIMLTSNISLIQYRVYKKLALLGYRLVRYDNKNNNNDRKRHLEQAENNPNKIFKDEDNIFKDIFQTIRSIMPQDCNQTINDIEPDYCVYSPMNSGKKPNFNLFICNGEIIQNNFTSNQLPNIYATCGDDVSFYKFSNIRLPQI